MMPSTISEASLSNVAASPLSQFCTRFTLNNILQENKRNDTLL